MEKNTHLIDDITFKLFCNALWYWKGVTKENPIEKMNIRKSKKPIAFL